VLGLINTKIKQKMKKMFDHPKYPMAMFLAITIVLLLIVFSFANLIDSSKEEIEKNNYKKLEKQLWENSNEYKEEIKTRPGISGFVTNEQEQPKTASNLEYPIKSYLMYYIILIVIVAGIFTLTTKVFLRRN